MTKDEALKLALEALEEHYYGVAQIIIREALAVPEQEPVAVYGYCPQCGAKGAMRERRPNGNDKCANGHTYPSSTSTPPQRTWVGLTTEDMATCIAEPAWDLILRKAEQILKEKNT